MNLIANGKADHYAEHNVASMSYPEPSPIEQLNWLIHVQHVRGEIASCKRLIKENITKSHGKNDYAYHKEGTILREEGKLQEALEAFQICHKLNQDDTGHVKEIAKCLYLLQRYRLALEAYLEAERASTKPDWEIFYNIAQCLILMGKPEKAREYVQKSLQYDKQEDSYALLIKILLQEGEIKSAITVCNAALENCPDSIEMLTQSGLLYLKSGQTQLAFERLSSALALEPTCSRALLGIGCITQLHEEYDVALTKYKLAIQTQSDSIALWNNIGMCFYSKQKYIAAIGCLKKALWLSPLNSRVLLNLGLIHLSIQQPASSFNYLCAATNLKPDLALTYVILACALFSLEDNESALRALKRAFSLAPDQPLIQLNTSVLLYHNGNYTEAKNLLEKFEASNFKNEEMFKLAAKLKVVLSKLVKEENQDEPEYAEINEEENVRGLEVFGGGIEHVEKTLSDTELDPDEV
ncbi:BBSome complex member BBS4 [Onthophagus taurus]|uniref:BBSome complex member BBS4 n=1 Tax=Onthophagus taurus TaxID=166361 RepID=UPI000C1FF9A8|nr:Bardet-Biedl syndrome 4 protein homolog [Onthophagus taurus]